MDNITLDSVKEHLVFFHALYDVVRLVDPIEKRVLEYERSCEPRQGQFCYDYWKSGEICENCISVRAHQDEKSYMKLERAEGGIMLVTAMPLINAPRPTVIELLKNATDTMMIGEGEYNSGHMMHTFIEELNAMVVSDALTGVYNRRFVEERLPAEIVRSLIEKKPLSVIFMDIDNLKAVNDMLGHAEGDQAIRSVAGVICRHIRDNADWVARVGGDEFFICLPSTCAEDAYQVSERIRVEIQRVFSTHQVPVSASMGVYTASDSHLTVKELMELADKRLYRAKRQGKNQVFSDQMDGEGAPGEKAP